MTWIMLEVYFSTLLGEEKTQDVYLKLNKVFYCQSPLHKCHAFASLQLQITYGGTTLKLKTQHWS